MRPSPSGLRAPNRLGGQLSYATKVQFHADLLVGKV
jgi:hypothetical protein